MSALMAVVVLLVGTGFGLITFFESQSGKLFHVNFLYLANRCPDPLVSDWLYQQSYRQVNTGEFGALSDRNPDARLRDKLACLLSYASFAHELGDEKKFGELIRLADPLTSKDHSLASEAVIARTYEQWGDLKKAESIYRELYNLEKAKLKPDQNWARPGDELVLFYGRQNRLDSEYQFRIQVLSDFEKAKCPTMADRERVALAEIQIKRSRPGDAKKLLTEVKDTDFRLLAWCHAVLLEDSEADYCYRKAIEKAAKLNHCGAHPNKNDITSGIELDNIEFEYLQRSEYGKYLKWKGRHNEAAVQQKSCNEVDGWFPANLARGQEIDISSGRVVPYKPRLIGRQNFQVEVKNSAFDGPYYLEYDGCCPLTRDRVPIQMRKKIGLLGGISYVYSETIGKEQELQNALKKATNSQGRLQALRYLWRYQQIHQPEKLSQTEKEILSCR